MKISTRHYKSILKLVFIMSLFFCKTIATAQKQGCTDPLANNQEEDATINDGSCKYNSTAIKAQLVANLPSTLTESSGLIYFQVRLWSHNDEADTGIYELNTVSGEVIRKIKLPKVLNKDWEDISQDSTYIYIADTGNNYQGNRNDLHILRVSKTSFLEEKHSIDTISFSYSNLGRRNSQGGSEVCVSLTLTLIEMMNPDGSLRQRHVSQPVSQPVSESSWYEEENVLKRIERRQRERQVFCEVYSTNTPTCHAWT